MPVPGIDRLAAWECRAGGRVPEPRPGTACYWPPCPHPPLTQDGRHLPLSTPLCLPSAFSTPLCLPSAFLLPSLPLSASLLPSLPLSAFLLSSSMPSSCFPYHSLPVPAFLIPLCLPSHSPIFTPVCLFSY
ncbi:hypothetical protein Pcinc_036010 [Petrolisthes cinctipes]|uniref:Uncharacterized protein n=1 Tax=Petrolisthes cinctipes TaxID=88211 RepID=A0AAE1BZR1_PETCI|nr:hypothetical protein Pcinc_036010 [Petrolisthes cinctipes]